ncbi:Ig-like domain-containing protein [Halosimplex aquaticum]
MTDVWTNPLPAAPGYRMLVVDLVPGTYDLRMAKAGVGTRVTGTDAAYVTAPSGANATVPEDGSQRLVVEVRDAYNNPVAGVEVTGSADVGALASRTATTGENGRATFRYDAPSVTAATEASVNVSYAVDPGLATAFDGRRPENAELTVTVQNTKVDGPSGGGGGDPRRTRSPGTRRRSPRAGRIWTTATPRTAHGTWERTATAHSTSPRPSRTPSGASTSRPSRGPRWTSRSTTVPSARSPRSRQSQTRTAASRRCCGRTRTGPSASTRSAVAPAT